MTTTYEDTLTDKNFVGNAVILLKGKYFCIREPDSGLTIDPAYWNTISALSINPTQVDLKRATTTITTHSFQLSDVGGVLSALFAGNTYLLTGEDVTIWIGRTGVGLDFADYYELPLLKVKGVSYAGDKVYSFSVAEQTDRMNKSIFSLKTTLAGSISSGTTGILVSSGTDLSTWPTSGVFRIDDEFGTYAGVDTTLNELTGCTRGYKGTTAVAHDEGATVYNVVDVSDNPLNILLGLLVSHGGGGTYDTLSDGLAIDESLIDVAGIESLRDAYFAGQTWQLSLYGISNALSFIETEIFTPCNLRLATSSDSKITVVLLNKELFDPDPVTIDEDTITTLPTWKVDENLIVNQLQVSWDWDEGTQTYNEITTYPNDSVDPVPGSITQYGAKPVYSVSSKGIKAALGGQAIVDAFASDFLGRFAVPRPTVELSAQMDVSLVRVGAKPTVTTTKLPTSSGDYDFSAKLEVLSRGINYFTGDVTLQLVFTSYSLVRQCFIAPSHAISTVYGQSAIGLPAGAGAFYRAGWPMRIFDRNTGDWLPDGTRTIDKIIGDTVFFTTPWATTLNATSQWLKLPKYSETVASQRVYCFIGEAAGADFTFDGSGPYLITF